jgi:hypothetical protein
MGLIRERYRTGAQTMADLWLPGGDGRVYTTPIMATCDSCPGNLADEGGVEGSSDPVDEVGLDTR